MAQTPSENSLHNKKFHSVPVPQLYKEASKILKRMENKEGSLKTLVYSSKYKNYRKIYALLCKTWSHRSRTKHVLAASKVLKEQPNFDPHLAQVLTTELLEKGSLSGSCKPVQVLLKYEEELKSLAANTLYEEREILQNKNHIPRYVRINTLVASVEAVQSQLSREGWWAIEYDKNRITYDDFLHKIDNLEDQQYLKDYHLPELLVFPPNTPFWDSILYQENAVILQDKASCLPVFISNIRPGASILDACAAPGNKTSQIASAINNTGKIIASEKSFSRYKTLKKLLHQRGATCVTTINQDFTKLSPNLTAGVGHIFLDPTCSSSGTCSHKDEIQCERLQKLAAFQVHLLQHALSHPSVQEVVYSTCSINTEENEEVVQSVLSQYGEEYELENLQGKLKGWKHFGNKNYECGKYCLRTEVEADKCHGFFVAKFIRKKPLSQTNVTKKGKKHKRTTDTESCFLKIGKKKKLKAISASSRQGNM